MNNCDVTGALVPIDSEAFPISQQRDYLRDAARNYQAALRVLHRYEARAAELQQQHASFVQAKTESRIRILTILSAICLPLTLIAVLSALCRPGDVVLDLGSGPGLDAFLAARRVGRRRAGEVHRAAERGRAHRRGADAALHLDRVDHAGEVVEVVEEQGVLGRIVERRAVEEFLDRAGVGWFLAIVGIAAIREKIRYSNIPAPLRGLGITFIITGLMGIAFMSFMGIKL